jgi:hypothetical protein
MQYIFSYIRSSQLFWPIKLPTDYSISGTEITDVCCTTILQCQNICHSVNPCTPRFLICLLCLVQSCQQWQRRLSRLTVIDLSQTAFTCQLYIFIGECYLVKTPLLTNRIESAAAFLCMMKSLYGNICCMMIRSRLTGSNFNHSICCQHFPM